MKLESNNYKYRTRNISHDSISCLTIFDFSKKKIYHIFCFWVKKLVRLIRKMIDSDGNTNHKLMIFSNPLLSRFIHYCRILSNYPHSLLISDKSSDGFSIVKLHHVVIDRPCRIWGFPSGKDAWMNYRLVLKCILMYTQEIVSGI